VCCSMGNGTVAIAIALTVVALFLSGCGSGGSESRACVNTKFDIPTQSFSGRSTVTMDAGPIKKTSEGTKRVMFDREKLNVRQDSATSVTANGVTVSVNMKEFVSISKMLGATSVDMTINGKKNSTCFYFDLSKVQDFPSAQQIKAGLDMAIQMIAEQMKCTGNDGFHDTFVWDEKIPNKDFPLPQNISGLEGEIKEQIQTDKNLMLHSTSATIDIKTPATKIENQTIPAQTSSEAVTLTVDEGAAKPQGPTDEDLDYSSWGECSEVDPNLAGFFKPSCSDAWNLAFNAVSLGLHCPKPSLFFRLVVGTVDELLHKPAITEMV